MIIATFAAPALITAEGADLESRTIAGVAVPWGEVGTVSDGRRVRFHPGSLPPDARPVVVLGHGGPAIGVATANVDDGERMRSSVRVSRTRDGDDALTLAGDGVLRMFSVGADPTAFDFDDEGVMNVRAASWQHLALLPFGAFQSAVVDSVAASPPPPQGENEMTMTEALSTTAPAPALEATVPTTVPSPAPAVVPIAGGRPAAPELTIQRFAGLVASTNRGEITADAFRATVQAALANVTSTNVGAVVMPAYRAEITGIVDHGTPLLTALGGSPLPGTGMSIEYPQWLVTPITGIQATEKTAIASGPATLTLKTAPVITIAGGNDISLQAVERSSPSFLEAYIRAAATDWGRKAEAYVLSVLTPLATDVTPPVGGSFLDQVQALLGALDPTLTPAGPLFVAMSYDMAMPLIGVKSTDGPAFWSGQISFGSMTPTVNADGLNMFVDWNLPAGTLLGGSVAAAPVHVSPGAPADIRVVDVSLLGLDVGVYGYLSVTPEYPGALAIMTVPSVP